MVKYGYHKSKEANKMAKKRSYWEALGALSYGANRMSFGGRFSDADRDYIAAVREMSRR